MPSKCSYWYEILSIGYQIEKCEVGVERWIPVTSFCPTTTYMVKNLDEGKQYRFRIRAENMYGVSDPLEGKPVFAKNPFGMCYYIFPEQ